MESKVTGSFARPDRSHYFAIAFAIVLISFSSAFATKLRCRDLATADADELLAMVDSRAALGRPRSKTTGCSIAIIVSFTYSHLI